MTSPGAFLLLVSALAPASTSAVDASACSFRSRVVVSYTQAYLDRVMAGGKFTDEIKDKIRRVLR